MPVWLMASYCPALLEVPSPWQQGLFPGASLLHGTGLCNKLSVHLLPLPTILEVPGTVLIAAGVNVLEPWVLVLSLVLGQTFFFCYQAL